MADQTTPNGHVNIETALPRKEADVRKLLFDYGMALLAMHRSDDLTVNIGNYMTQAEEGWAELHGKMAHLEALDEITRPSGSRGTNGRGMLPTAATRVVLDGEPLPGIENITPIQPAGYSNNLLPRDSD